MAAAEMPPPDALSDDGFLSSPARLCYRAAQSNSRAFARTPLASLCTHALGLLGLVDTRFDSEQKTMKCW